ncbi:gluconate 2-dehydrogenase subunit 3 family protein [Alloacidobacterium dinghuense]|uniref:Gluconate 2-dehydrogenase subunit 3 family protein n=1 Tax=Alloacidobacterium dinghuense TaxID=2763107 RepID=A0A7G8BDQ5_9BACT|nr:gluconate 2-dehydrogenase subunit 3 family protein [Alloacidobacterium dinghuense]QNI30675.1 gluconate 2-dehydrogenase subunit 3 family protein [Alloacidobacterium dinghuense]
MNRRELLRNSLLTMGAAAVTRPAGARIFPAGEDAFLELQRADWTPVFLNQQQNETLIVLSEAIIPATDTPGAKAALVNRFLDLVLSVEIEKNQREFVESLEWFDTGAQERYKTTFAKLTDGERTDFLNLVAWPHTQSAWGQAGVVFPGYLHFTRLKGWIASAYYSSPIGLKEQGWDGWAARGTFSGCEHQPGEHKAS